MVKLKADSLYFQKNRATSRGMCNLSLKDFDVFERMKKWKNVSFLVILAIFAFHENIEHDTRAIKK